LDIDDSSALIFFTYFMMDWAKLGQEPSETACMSCGGKMMRVEPIVDKKGVVFEGLVCHNCKTVLWSRKTSQH
jgi:hypothetical protein